MQKCLCCEYCPSLRSSGSTSLACPSAGSVDELDLLEVQVSGKSARSARRLTSRQGLAHLKSAPAGALQAAAEQAVADHLEDSSPTMYACASEDFSNHSSAYSPQSARSRYNRSQSHLDIPKQGSAAITLDTAASSSSTSTLLLAAPAYGNRPQLLSPFLVSPAAAPAVQQTAVPLGIAQQGSSQADNQTRQMSRKISGNKLILSSDDNLEVKEGEILLPPRATPFAHSGRAAFDDLEICFSGKSARMSRGGVRRPASHTISAH